MTGSSDSGFLTWLTECKQTTDSFLIVRLNREDDNRLLQAIRYSLLLGGKRLRPALVYASGELGGRTMAELLPVAGAVECIHAYSLIHDDLPAMDDDDLRRGQPSCHIQYDEATAILAGDGLQALAFELLAEDSHHGLSAESRLQMLQELADAAGYRGMVGGQAADMEGLACNLDQLARLHDMKTGALLCVSVRMGGLAAGLTHNQMKALTDYGHLLGRIFQIIDDCLDVTQDSEVTGKPQYSDAAQNKTTYVKLLGLKGAEKEAKRLSEKAMKALNGFGSRANRLRMLLEFVASRNF